MSLGIVAPDYTLLHTPLPILRLDTGYRTWLRFAFATFTFTRLRLCTYSSLRSSCSTFLCHFTLRALHTFYTLPDTWFYLFPTPSHTHLDLFHTRSRWLFVLPFFCWIVHTCHCTPWIVQLDLLLWRLHVPLGCMGWVLHTFPYPRFISPLDYLYLWSPWFYTYTYTQFYIWLYLTPPYIHTHTHLPHTVPWFTHIPLPSYSSLQDYIPHCLHGYYYHTLPCYH